jgi:hypothetical protein
MVIRATIKPPMAPPHINMDDGIYQLTDAPIRTKRNRIPILFTVPLTVMASPVVRDSPFWLKIFSLSVGFPDLNILKLNKY